MNEDKIDKLYELIQNIPITDENFQLIEEIKSDLSRGDYISSLKKIELLGQKKKRESANPKRNVTKEESFEEQDGENMTGMFPSELSDDDLERQYIGLLLTDPRLIKKYFYVYEECYFEDPELLNIYKSVIFTEGGAYTTEQAKRGFNFALKTKLKKEVRDQDYNMEEIYIDLKKLFVLRKHYLAIPIQSIQEKVMEIKEYELYDKMSVEEVESAVIQVNDTEKFKREVLNEGLTR